jgi:hypothetical protein
MEHKRLITEIDADEDPNVSNLLVTKSERAPTTEPVPDIPINVPINIDKQVDLARAVTSTALAAALIAIVYFIVRGILRSETGAHQDEEVSA